MAGDSDTGALVARFYRELWNAWDDEAVDAVLAAQFRFRGSLGTETEGLTEWRAYRDGVRAGAADFHNEIVDLVVDGHRAAARLLYTGTHTGPLAGIEATGRRFGYAGAAFFVSERGRLVQAWVLGDLTSLVRELTA